MTTLTSPTVFSDREFVETPNPVVTYREVLSEVPSSKPKRFVRIPRETAEKLLEFGLTLPRWLLPVQKSLGRIIALEENWDSYGARQIDDASIAAAFTLIFKIMKASTPPPAIVPVQSGDIQLEWHRNGIDLEVLVRPSGANVSLERDEQESSWTINYKTDEGLQQLIDVVSSFSDQTR